MTKDLNDKYAIVNKMIDNYIEDWNISPINLIKYLKKGTRNYDRFIQRTGLSDMKNIDKIIKDILEDRKNMFLDGVLSFDAFVKMENIKESVFYEVGESNISYEKKLADIMDTNLSHIEVVDPSKHFYNVNVFGDIFGCVIYTKSDIDEIIKHSLLNTMNSLMNKKLKVEFDTDLLNIHLPLSDILDIEDVSRRVRDMLTDDLIIKYITELINKEHGIEFKLETHDDVYIWRE